MTDSKTLFFKSFHGLLDSLFPPRCLICSKLIKTRHFCVVCDTRIEYSTSEHAAFAYSGAIKEAIRIAKFKPSETHAELLKEYLMLHYGDQLIKKYKNKIHLISYIPAHPIRLILRGFDLPKLLAVEVALLLDLPVVHLLKNKRYRKPRTLIQKKQDRAETPQGTFQIIDNPRIEYKNILLIDDVETTGGTLAAGKATIIRSIHCQVDVFVLAKVG